ncbi:MAG: NarK/NasA family nitrate transporter [Bacteroidetes bacterium]|nr:NarK/NasA family nitrate transporter [Bacteroidota bacterium]
METSSKSYRMLFLNTLAFTVCFAAWMLNGVLVTYLVNNGIFKWNPVQIGWLLGVPVLVGSIFRLPIGILTDKFGGKWVMGVLLFFCAVPMFFLSQANSFSSFLLLSFGFGMAGSIFAAGVAYTSLWFPKEKQGTALGIFGVGNAGAALTTLFAPTILNHLTQNGTQPEGWRTLPQLYAAMLVVMAIIFLLTTENKKPAEIKTMGQRLAPLKEMRVWRFGLYYFFVFGGIVTLAQWLLPYYVNMYSVSIVTAGVMVSAFSLPAGLIRAAGGWLSDKVGARTVLLWVFGVSIVCLFFLFPPRMEIRAPGQGIMASKPGSVTAVSDSEIVIDEARYMLQPKSSGSSQSEIRLGIFHNADEDFTALPTSSFWQEPQVKVGETVTKGQLLAKGFTHIYFQANKWIFFTLIFILGIMMGVGTAAVYKHISDYYPNSIGTVGGIVGVIGGLGGFLNPILFGYLLKGTGVWTTCWMFLAVVAAICIVFQSFAIKSAKLSEAQRKAIDDKLQ